MRDRLIELISQVQYMGGLEGKVADYLISNGVIVPPCKVGDTVYDIADGTAYATKVLQFVYFGDRWACRTVSSFPNLEGFGTRVFLTREEAEKALKESEGI